MSITIGKAIEKLGQNVCFQYLDECTLSCKKNKGDTAITFVTNEYTPDNFMRNDGKFGIVVWVDKEEFHNAVKE